MGKTPAVLSREESDALIVITARSLLGPIFESPMTQGHPSETL
jgi:hypothetical protein